MGHLSDIFFKKYTSWIRWLHCLQSMFHFLEFILKSATIDLNTTSGSGCNVRHSFQHLFICNCLSKSVDGVLQDLMLNVVCRISSEFSQTLRPKPIIQWREIRAMVALLSINSRKWNVDCKQCNHLIHDVYFLKNISLKCPNQTIKMTPSF